MSMCAAGLLRQETAHLRELLDKVISLAAELAHCLNNARVTYKRRPIFNRLPSFFLLSLFFLLWSCYGKMAVFF